MAKNLGRLLTPAAMMKLNLSRLTSEPANAAAMRLISYTTEKLRDHQQLPSNRQEPIIASDSQPEADHDHHANEEEEGCEEEEEEHVNKETGEVGGPRGPEPTRFGDWEKNGRCSDF